MSNQVVAETGACCSPLVREPLTEDWAGDLARMFKALGDPVRLRLLSLVASHEGGEACVCDISDTFDLSQPTISHHLKVLRQAGLLDCERRGTWVYYWVIPAALQQLSAVLLVEWLHRDRSGRMRGGHRMSNTAATTEHPAVVGKLSTLDRYLAVWIGVAMVVGLLVGRWIPGVNTALDKVQIDGISLPIALGLLIMMYPVLAKVRYDRLDTVTGDKKLLAGSAVPELGSRPGADVRPRLAVSA